MPELQIAVGWRSLTIEYEPHEQEQVSAAAEVVSSEVKAIHGSGDRGEELPPSQLLLFASLRIAGRLLKAKAELARAEEALAVASKSDESSELALLDGLSTVAGLAEDLADRIERQAAARPE